MMTSFEVRQLKIKETIALAENKINSFFDNENNFKEWLAFEANFHNYSYYNAALIIAQYAEASVTGSFDFWKEKGLSVTRNEKGIGILIPVSNKNSFAFKMGYTFDIAQTNASAEDKERLFKDRIKELSEYSFNNALIDYGKKNDLILNGDINENIIKILERTYLSASKVAKLSAEEKLIINALEYSISNYFKLNIDHNSLQYIKEWGKDKSLWNKKMLIKYIHGITHDFITNITPFVKEHLQDEPKPIVEDKEKITNSTESKKEKITDFGEKIGGARKDLWRERGLIIDDLLQMTDEEKDKYVKKDNIFKKPDYDKLISDGKSKTISYFIKRVRDSLPNVPSIYEGADNEAKQQRREEYIELIKDIKDKLFSIEDDYDILHFYKNFINNDTYFKNTGNGVYHGLKLTSKGKDITNKMLKAMYVSSIDGLIQELNKKQFGIKKEDKIPSGYDIRKYTGGGYVSGDKDWIEDTYYITHKYKIIKINIPDYETALKTAQKIACDNKRTRKSKFVPSQLKNVERIAPGKENSKNISGDNYMDEFGFRGGEFGNWVNEVERQYSLNYGYDALCDLATALNISLKDISLGNKLAIAFGSRGRKSAAAHYEPEREVINLTKMHGAGSLCHEWGHAFDNIIAKKLGLSKKFMTESTEEKNLPSIIKLVDNMLYKSADKEEQLKQQEKDLLKATKALDSLISYYIPKSKCTECQLIKLNSIREEMIEVGKVGMEDYSFLDTAKGISCIDAMSELYKEITGKVLKKDYRIQFYWCVHNFKIKDYSSMKIETDFYKNSLQFDKTFSKEDRGYWSSSIEMFARAFACYVHDRLNDLGIKSDYLCGHSESAITFVKTDENSKMIPAYPVGEERKKLNKCFDEVFLECLERGIFSPKEDSHIIMESTLEESKVEDKFIYTKHKIAFSKR